MKIDYKISPEIDNTSLNKLFSESWVDYTTRSFEYLHNSLFYVCCYDENELVGFINIASDGYLHAFILDVTVSPGYRRKGIGTELIQKAITDCKIKGIEWVHVDYVEHLETFYYKCGFKDTKAGLINLKN